MASRINSLGQTQAIFAKDGEHVLHLLETNFTGESRRQATTTQQNFIKYVVIDDAQYLNCSEEAWRKIIQFCKSQERYLHIYLDSRYQSVSPTPWLEVDVSKAIKTAVNELDGYSPPPLRDIYRNNKVVVDFMSEISCPMENDSFICKSSMEGQDVRLKHLPNMLIDSEHNELVQFVEDFVRRNYSSGNLYQYSDIAILVETPWIAEKLRTIFERYLKESKPQTSDTFPVQGITIDTLKNFMGLEANLVLYILDNEFLLRDKRFVTAVASRSVAEMIFLTEHVIHRELVDRLSLDAVPQEDEWYDDLANFVRPEHPMIFHDCLDGNIDRLKDEIAERPDWVNRTLGGLYQEQITPLMLATTAGHLSCVELLIQKGADVNAVIQFRQPVQRERRPTALSSRRTVLSIACEKGHQKIAEKLVEHEALINHEHDSALTRAVIEGHLDLVKWLIEKGANVQPSHKYEASPIYQALANGHLQVAEFLLTHGAVMDECTNDVLCDAARDGKKEIVHWMAKKGADTNAVGVNDRFNMFNKRTALSLACEQGHLEIAEILVSHGASIDHDLDPALLVTAQKGHLDLLKWLLHMGADVNVARNERNAQYTGYRMGPDPNMVNIMNKTGTALYLACHHGHMDIAKELVRHKAVINHDLYPALCGAARRGRLEILRWLIENGADVNAVEGRGKIGLNQCTALALACLHGYLQAAEELIDSGARINDEHVSVLYSAVFHRRLDIIQLLIKKGADVNAVFSNMSTALSQACLTERKEIAKELITHGATINHDQFPALCSAVRKGRLEFVKWLIEEGADVNAVGLYRRTALSLACQEGDSEIAEELYRRGAEINNGHDSALCEAIRGGQFEIATWLIERGADVNIVSQDKRSALSLACQKGSRETAENLVEHGATINHEADPALCGAALGGHMSIVKWLIEEKEANVQQYVHGEYPPIFCACATGHVAIADELLRHGGFMDEGLGDKLRANCRTLSMATVEWVMQHGTNSQSTKDIFGQSLKDFYG